MTLPTPIGAATVLARYAVKIEPLTSREAIADVGSRTVGLWDLAQPGEEPWSRQEYIGSAAEEVGSYRVTWEEGVRRPLEREALWRVHREGGSLVWSALDLPEQCRNPYWLREALSGLLRDANVGLRELDLTGLPDRTPLGGPARSPWWFMHGVGAARPLRLDDFDPDSEPEDDDVIHLRDLPELLWLAAGWPGEEPGDWHQGFLDLARGVFGVLGETEHWLYKGLPERLERREQIIEAVTASPSSRDARTLCDLWQWRDRLMEPARAWSGVLMCQHPVLRGRGGKTWEGWSEGDGDMSDRLAGLGDDIARRVLDNIDVARRIGEALVGMWGLGELVDEPVTVRKASVLS